MIDLPNKIEDNIESVDSSNLDNPAVTDLNQNINDIPDIVENRPEMISEESNDNNVVNCLALTVKKDYSLSIVKNVVLKTFRSIWKVAISIFTLNLLKFFM